MFVRFINLLDDAFFFKKISSSIKHFYDSMLQSFMYHIGRFSRWHVPGYLRQTMWPRLGSFLPNWVLNLPSCFAYYNIPLLWWVLEFKTFSSNSTIIVCSTEPASYMYIQFIISIIIIIFLFILCTRSRSFFVHLKSIAIFIDSQW